MYYWSKESYLQQTQNLLLNNIEIISYQLSNQKDLAYLAQRLKKNLHLRLTIIKADGTILVESHQQKNKHINYKYQDEIVQANKEPFGMKIRHSFLLDKDYLYIAKRYPYQGSFLYIRLSKEIKKIDKQILLLSLKIFSVLVLFFLGIFFIMYKIGKEIEKETIKIVTFLTALTKKEKNTYIYSNFSTEFLQITKLLTKVAQILDKKEKQKSKYTAKLQLLNRQKDDIISAISHEFKNPIAIINGYCQTLLEDKNLNENIRIKFLKKIYKNGVKLNELIDTLRLSIKLESKKQSLSFSTINLYEVVKDSVENIEINYPKRKILIKGKKDVMLKADRALMGVVLSNLIENGCKYSEDDVIVTITKNSIEIQDSGIGISQKDIEKITNKFYRVHENSWNNSLGLGLFIVNNILELHRFQLKITSKENVGSTFKIVF